MFCLLLCKISLFLRQWCSPSFWQSHHNFPTPLLPTAHSVYTASHHDSTAPSLKGVQSRTHAPIQPHLASGSPLLRPDGAISREPGEEPLFSWRHLRRCALTPGETHNLACLPPSELLEPAGEAPQDGVYSREGGRKRERWVTWCSCLRVREEKKKRQGISLSQSVFQNGKCQLQAEQGGERDLFCGQIVCFMNVKGCLQQVGFIRLVLDAYRQPPFCPSSVNRKVPVWPADQGCLASSEYYNGGQGVRHKTCEAFWHAGPGQRGETGVVQWKWLMWILIEAAMSLSPNPLSPLDQGVASGVDGHFTSWACRAERPRAWLPIPSGGFVTPPSAQLHPRPFCQIQ